MTSAKDKIKYYLQREPRGRERKNKDRAILNLLLKEYGWAARMIDTRETTKDSMVRFLQDYATMDRAWRHLLSEEPSLRGKDYGEKTMLEQEKIIELGYEVGSYQDIKKKI